MKKNQGWTHFYEKKPAKFFRIMKLLLVLLMATTMTISAKTFSQCKVTLSVKDVGVMELFREIQKKTNVYLTTIVLSLTSNPMWDVFSITASILSISR